MSRTFRTKEETIKYFKQIAYECETIAHRSNDETVKIKERARAEAYELAAFELEHNME